VITAGLILAAGQSTRFGSDKRQALGAWSGPLLHHVLGLYRPLFTNLGVVIGSDDRFGEEACRLFSAHGLVNPEAPRGIGGSLAVGIGWLAAQGFGGVVVGLADMPWIAANTIAQVKTALERDKRAVAPSFDQQIGFPRGIPAGLFAALSRLEGDRGAAQILDWRQALLLPCDDPGILRDIDLPEDISS
jgi:molybdenum cofactor cytidylyltransferase